MTHFSTSAERQKHINTIPSQRTQRPIRALMEQVAADVQFANWGANPSGAQDYFVDGNAGNTSGNGLSWDTPMKELPAAIAASNVSIVASTNRWWARRNRIFVLGDQEITDDLTIFPEKCDIIGVGFDIEPMPRITGHHIIAALATGKAYGTRLINLGWMCDDAGEHFHFVKDHMAIEFHGCKFWPLVTGSTHCIRLADNNRAFKMYDSQIYVHAASPSVGIYAECVKVEGVGQHDQIYQGNFMHGTEGIHIVASTGGYNSFVDRNIIRATALTVNDAAGLAVLTDNRLITAVDCDTGFVNGVVSDANLAANNVLTHTGSDLSEHYPFILDAA